jgi:L-fucose mutarotase/ribose pyranase (RbsD/FucU family)
MASHGRRFKRLSVDAVAKILADIESELSDFTAKCVMSPCTQENTLRTFIQRRIMHELEKQEETAQKMSCMYLYSFYFNS